MSKTTIQNLIIFGIALMMLVIIVIGGKFLMMEFPDYEEEFSVLRFFGAIAVLVGGSLLCLTNAGEL